MAVKKINWNLTENYTFKPVDSISVINRKVETTQSAWGLDNNLVMPTTKFWLYYKLTNLDKISTVNGRFPFFYSTSSISGSFNKIIFPSLNPENFLTQSLNSVVYYLDVYNSVKIPLELNTGDHLYKSHSVYSDSSNLIFQTSQSSTGYSTMGLLPDERVFSIAWGNEAGSGSISGSYLPFTLYSKPTQAVYYTYKSILNETSSLLTVGTGSVTNFFAIHLDKQKLKSGIIPGTIELPLMISASSAFFTSSNLYNYPIISITDYTESLNNDNNIGKYAYLVSGTLNNKLGSDVYGTIYYDLGILFLDSNKLDLKLSMNLNYNQYPIPTFPNPFPELYTEDNLNTVKLFNSIQACSYINSNSNSNLLITTASNFSPRYFKIKTKENTVENPIYVVLKPNEFNFSLNSSWQKNEIQTPSEIISASIPTSCESFKNLGYGCNELENSQQKYVYWYYPTKKLPETVFAAHFIKNDIGICNCEYLGNLHEYKKNNRLPHLNYKTFSTRIDFLNNPITYITSIGLYDDLYQLLAVAKLSKPLKKDQFTTYMFKINLKI